MKLKVVFLVFKIYSLAHFLVFQGSAGEGLPPSPSTFPVIPPDLDGTPPPIPSGTVTGSGAPAPSSLPKVMAPAIGLPPPSSPPAPQNVSPPPSSPPAPQIVSPPPSSPPAPQIVSPPPSSPPVPQIVSPPPSSPPVPQIVSPPPSSAPAPQNVSEQTPPSIAPSFSPPTPSVPSTISPAFPPIAPNGSSSPLLPAPLAPAPRISPLPPPSPAPVEGSPPPKPDEHEAPEAPLLPPIAPVSSPPDPKISPQTPPPKPDEHQAPEAPLPPIAPVSSPPAPRISPQTPPPKPDEHKAPEAPLPPIAPVSNQPAPKISPQTPPPKPDVHKTPESPLPPIAPVSSPPVPTRPHNIPPTYSITPRVSPPTTLPVPFASPPIKSSGSPPTVSPAKPPAISSEPDPYHAPPPLFSINWNGTGAPVAASPNVTSTWHAFNASSPRISPKPPARSRLHPPVPQPSSPLNRRYHHKDVRFHAPPPSSSGLAVPPSRLPHPPPNGSTSPLPVMPKVTPFHALPPPPPNQDCTSYTCIEPLTNAPPGSPCSCVLPIQVGLLINVALYNFFPLVSEFASEISSGIFLKLSQVRIMGANAATGDPEKTIVLTDLVPLGDTFDKTKAYQIYQRFWLKDVSIKSSLFGDYEVLFVRYPGLPASPPSAPSYGGTIGSNPYSGRNNAAAVKPVGVDVGRNHHRRLSGSVIAIIVLSAAFVVLLCCAIAWAVVLKQRKKLSEAESTPPLTLPSIKKASGLSASTSESGPSSYVSSLAAYTGSAKTFRSSEIEKATDNFSETRVIGEGGFGRVYSGVLEDGTEVAVKVLKRVDQQGGREFLAEVEMLSRLHHRNLVKLIGICTEDRARCLVYELVPNGSVESHIHGVDRETAPLDWGARLKIALGAARGLAYLHEDSSPRVIHRDFKSSNILLENDFTPKVSDFGLARSALDEDNKHISTRVMGTFGYVAPEYAMTGHLLVKSDVYSYGVVLLELLTSRKPVDMSQPPGQENLVSWARPLLTSDEGLESMIDPSLGPDFPFLSISKVAAIASMCVQPEVTNRPFMGEVVQALKLISNERDETFEMASSFGTSEMEAAGPTRAVNHTSGLHFPGDIPYHSDVDVERGYSSSELLSSSARYAMHDSVSRLRNSGSGSLSMSGGGSGKARRLWQKMRHLSGGTVSEHGSMLRLWNGSR